MHHQDFGAMFQECAPYIDLHREKIIVMHIPGTVMKNREELSRVVDDIRCLHLLGSKLVLVTGVVEQLESKLRQIKPFPDAPYVNKMPVTDSTTLQKLMEAS